MYSGFIEFIYHEIFKTNGHICWTVIETCNHGLEK